MIKAVDARTMIPTHNGVMLEESLWQPFLHDKLVLVLAVTILAISREMK